MRNNKIIVRLILSISFIFAGLILMLNGKREIRFEKINTNIYNAEDSQMFVSKKSLYYPSNNGYLFGIPQFFYNKDNPKGSTKQVYCIERGGWLNTPSIPYNLQMNEYGEPISSEIIKKSNNIYEIKGVKKAEWNIANNTRTF